jgi:D-lactate dehydrogenase (cytochrome)
MDQKTTNQFQPMSADTRDKVGQIVSPQGVLELNESYERDASELRFRPEMVVAPQDVRQIQRLLQLANQQRFAVTARGGGSGLAGGCLAVSGGVVLSLSAMPHVCRIDPVNLIAEASSGVITAELKAAAVGHGLLYPPDPAGMELSTIGGNAATSAGGPACLKYGTTKDYILGLEAVLPSGQLIKTGTQTRKGVVGYDLTQLLVGSEGTLAIITKLFLKLIPMPPAVAGLTAAFESMEQAMRTVTAVMGSGCLPSAIEFMDAKCLDLVKDLLPFPPAQPGACLLIVETDGGPEQVRTDIQSLSRLFTQHGAQRLLTSFSEPERDKLWKARREVSLRIHDNAALYVSEDVVVPLGAIADLVSALPNFEQRHNLNIYAFGHAGDGNIHLNITAADRAHMPEVERAVAGILKKVLQLGGTISGEHGIGAAKKQYLPLELSAASIALQRGIKKLFDPNNILNPGKIFPLSAPTGLEGVRCADS